MAKVTHESLERLRERKEQLEAKLKRLRHQQRYQNRKEDARRKFIVGAAVEAAVAGGDMEPELLERVLNQYITKARERKFMELDPPPETRNKRDA